MLEDDNEDDSEDVDAEEIDNNDGLLVDVVDADNSECFEEKEDVVVDIRFVPLLLLFVHGLLMVVVVVVAAVILCELMLPIDDDIDDLFLSSVVLDLLRFRLKGNSFKLLLLLLLLPLLLLFILVLLELVVIMLLFLLVEDDFNELSDLLCWIVWIGPLCIMCCGWRWG